MSDEQTGIRGRVRQISDALMMIGWSSTSVTREGETWTLKKEDVEWLLDVLKVMLDARERHAPPKKQRKSKKKA